MRTFEAKALASGCSVALALAFVAGMPARAQAFGNATHIAVANAMLDEFESREFPSSSRALVFVVNGEQLRLEVDVEEAYQAIVDHPAYFRAGSLGPNAFPDPISGKLFFSGNESQLLKDLTATATAATDPCRSVTCPMGQRCKHGMGSCEADPCNGVMCSGGQVCKEGSCVEGVADPARGFIPESHAITEHFEDRHGPSEMRAIDLPMAMLALARSGAYAFDAASQEQAKVLAFIMGYFAHAGSGFGQNWINDTVGGVWSFTDTTDSGGAFGAFTEEAQIFALENYLDGNLPAGLVSTNPTGLPRDRLSLRVPIRFLDAFYSREVPNPVAFGDRAGETKEWVAYYGNLDRFHGGPVYSYFNAQQTIAQDAIGWAPDEVGDFFAFAAAAQLEPWQDALVDVTNLSPISMPCKACSNPLVDIGVALADQGSSLLGMVLTCGVDFDLGSSSDNVFQKLRDIWEYLGGFESRIDGHSELARVARLNWMRLSECSAENMARARDLPFNPATPNANRDRCREIAEAGWLDEGNPDGIDRGALRPGSPEGATQFLAQLRDAFRGTDPLLGVTFEQANDHRALARNVDRMLNYLITVGLTVDKIDRIVLTDDAGSTILNNYDAICDAFNSDLFRACVDGLLAVPVATFRASVCVAETAACTTSAVADCTEAFCQATCDAGTLGLVSGLCDDTCDVLGLVACTGACTGGACAAIGWCEPISAGIACGIACNELLDDVDDKDCTPEAIFECGEESVECAYETFREIVVADERPAAELFEAGREMCVVVDDALDKFRRFKDPATRAQLLPQSVQNLTGTVQQLRNTYGTLIDVLIEENPDLAVNIAFFIEDLNADPFHAFTVLAAMAAVPQTTPAQIAAFNAFNCVLANRAGIGFFLGCAPPAVPPGPGLSPVEAAVIQNAHDQGVIPQWTGPMVNQLRLQLGPDFVSSFKPFYNSVQAAKLAPLARQDIETLLDENDVDDGLLPWNNPNGYSASCSVAGQENLLCDVVASFEDPNCRACSAADRTPSTTAPFWVPGRGLIAWDATALQSGPHVLTKFPLAASEEAYDKLYEEIFCSPLPEWSAFRGGPQRNGRSPAYGPTDSFFIDSYLATGDIRSSPVIAPDGAVVFNDVNGVVYALEADLTERWTTWLPGDTLGSPLYHDGFVYVGSTNNSLFKLDIADGEIVWELPTNGDVNTSPIVGDDGIIVFGSRDRRIYGVNQDGTLSWSFLAADPIDSSPALSRGGLIHFGTDGGELWILEPGPGLSAASRLEARIGLGAFAVTKATPAIGDEPRQMIFVGSTNDEMRGMLAGGTTQWWSRPFLSGDFTTSAAIGADGMVYVGSASGRLFAYQGDAGAPQSGSYAPQWSFFADGPIRSSPLVDAAGTIYFGDDIGFFYGLLPGPGLSNSQRVVFKQFLGVRVRSSPAMAADGTIYVGADSNQLFAIRKTP